MTARTLSLDRARRLALPGVDWAILAALNLVGVAAYLYPFVLAAVLDPASDWYEHRGEGPLLMGGVAALGLCLVISELTAGRLNSRSLALLGVIAAMAAVLRTVTLPAGANLYFFLVILGGWSFGARPGFVLGALSFFLSAVVTGGIGPWLPFQLFAAAWMGLSAGAAGSFFRRREVSRAEVGAVVLLGMAWGMVFGFVVNLWFWPFWVGGPDVTFEPGIGVAEAVRRYANFYLLTSAGWDVMRAACNALVLASLGPPLLRAFREYHDRFDWEPG